MFTVTCLTAKLNKVTRSARDHRADILHQKFQTQIELFAPFTRPSSEEDQFDFKDKETILHKVHNEVIYQTNQERGRKARIIKVKQ